MTMQQILLAASAADPLTASAVPNTAIGIYSESNPVQTNHVTVTPTGGQSPYSYAWASLSGDTVMAISSTTSATVRWSRNMTIGDSYQAIWRCTVTDAGGATATADVEVTFNA